MQDGFCPSFRSSSSYEVNLTANDPITVDHLNCGEVCMITFNNLTIRTTGLEVSIKAENQLGTSDIVVYPVVICKSLHVIMT